MAERRRLPIGAPRALGDRSHARANRSLPPCSPRPIRGAVLLAECVERNRLLFHHASEATRALAATTSTRLREVAEAIRRAPDSTHPEFARFFAMLEDGLATFPQTAAA